MEIINESGDRDNFTIVPNFIFWIGLSPYAVALYGHIKQIAGENGRCYTSTPTIAADLGMSAGAVTNAKRELVSHDLIRITDVPRKGGGKAYHSITILNVWERNAKAVQARALLRSPDEQAISQGVLANSPHEIANSHGVINKNPLNKNPQIKNPEHRESAPAENPQPVKYIRPPAVEAFKEVRGHYPEKVLWCVIDTDVGSDPDKLNFWKEVLTRWVGAGFKPSNVDGALDCFRRGELPSTKPKSNGHDAYAPEGIPRVSEMRREDFTNWQWARMSPENQANVLANEAR